MAQITVTEALAQIKIIKDRIEKKNTNILQYVAASSTQKDPHEANGGSTKYIASERQAISKLQSNLVAIRVAIQKKNLESPFTIGETSMSVAEWLIWRREVSDPYVLSLKRLSSAILTKRASISQEASSKAKNSQVVFEEPKTVVYLDEAKLAKEQEDVANTLGVLDSRLSVFNAIALIEVDLES